MGRAGSRQGRREQRSAMPRTTQIWDTKSPMVSDGSGVRVLNSGQRIRSVRPGSLPELRQGSGAALASDAGADLSALVVLERQVDKDRLERTLHATSKAWPLALARDGEIGEASGSGYDSKLAGLRKKLAKLVGRVEELTSENSELKEKQMRADKRLANHKLKVQTLEQNITAFKKERRQLVKETNEGSCSVHELEQDNETLRIELRAVTHDRDQLIGKLRRAESELANTAQKSSRLAMEHQALAKAAAARRQQAEESQQKASAFEQSAAAELEQLRSQLSNKLAQLERMEAENRQFTDNEEVVARRMAALELTVEAVEKNRRSAVSIGVGCNLDAVDNLVRDIVDQTVENAVDLQVALCDLTVRTQARSAAIAAEVQHGRFVRPAGTAWWLEQGAAHAVPSEADLRRVFDSIDEDKSGTLDSIELQQLFQKFGQAISPVEARAMLDQADADGDGHVDWHEFRDIVKGNFSSELWFAAARLVAAKAAATIQRAVRARWPRCARDTVASAAKVVATLSPKCGTPRVLFVDTHDQSRCPSAVIAALKTSSFRKDKLAREAAGTTDKLERSVTLAAQEDQCDAAETTRDITNEVRNRSHSEGAQQSTEKNVHASGSGPLKRAALAPNDRVLAKIEATRETQKVEPLETAKQRPSNDVIARIEAMRNKWGL